MKNKYLIAILLIFHFIAFSQNKNKGHVVCEIINFENTSDVINLTLAINLKGEIVDKCEAKAYIPMLESGNTTQMFPYTVVYGGNKRHMLKRWYSLDGKNQENTYLDVHSDLRASKNMDTLVTYNLSIPKIQWMNATKLVVREETFGCNNVIDILDFVLDDNILRKGMENKPEVPIVTPHAPVEEKPAYIKDIYFHLNRTEIDFSYHNNMKEAQEIVSLINDSNKEIESIIITGYASPEGPYNNNDRLSLGRAKSVQTYILQNTGFNDNKIRMRWVPENWSGLVDLLKDSNLSNRSEIIRIVENNSLSTAQRHAQIKRLDNNYTYNLLLKEYYPELRKVECQVIYKEKDDRTYGERIGEAVKNKKFTFY